MRPVILILLAVGFAVWYGVQRSRVTRAREYSNAATERWENEGGGSRSSAGAGAVGCGQSLRDDQAMMS
jgi:hypothetical protein